MLRVGIVLGAGGGTGRAFHAGVLAAIDDMLGIDARDAQVIVGTSAGAADAALVRAGISPHDLYAHVIEGECSPAGAAMFAGIPRWSEPDEQGPPVRWRPCSPARLALLARRPWEVRPRSMGTVVAAMMPLGRRPTDVIEDTLMPLYPGGWPERELWVCAVNLDDGRRVIFGRDGDAPSATVGLAVAASCAVPGYFAPVVIDGVRYVDGGMFSPSNADVLAGSDLDLVIISSPQTMVPSGLRTSVDSWFRASCRWLTRRETAQVRRAGHAVLLIEPTAEDLRVMGTIQDSMSRRPLVDIAKQAYESTARRIRSGTLAHAELRGAAYAARAERG